MTEQLTCAAGIRRLNAIIQGADSQLGGLLHADGAQLRKVVSQLLQVPQVLQEENCWYAAGGRLVHNG